MGRDILRASWKVTDDERDYIYVPNNSASFRYNADGFLCYSTGGSEITAYGYTQLFRSGIVEYADCNIYRRPSPGQPEMILGQQIEQQMVNCYKDATARLRKQGQLEPIYVGFSLVGIANKFFYSTMMTSISNQHVARDNIFISPEVLVDLNEAEEPPFSKTLLPLIDTMWQVAGREGTPFKPKGVWNPFKQYQ